MFAFALALGLVASPVFAAPTAEAVPGAAAACAAIKTRVSKSSGVYFPNSTNYADGVYHWSPTNQINATCVVEAGSVNDVSAIMKVISASKTPFGIKGGGHSCNQGFSSTNGVLVSMKKFNGVSYDASSTLVSLGPGGVWNDVYDDLAQYNVTVPGGRIHGVGVGGYLLGGGYSWFTNEFGLAIDNIVSYELVLPSGKIVEVTNTAYPDLFFALKGGLNNYGIVTKFVIKSRPLGNVWGGTMTVAEEHYEDLIDALENYSANATDIRGQAAAQFISINGTRSCSLTLFYNGTAPSKDFDTFLALPRVDADFGVRTLTSFIGSASQHLFNYQRQRSNADAPVFTDGTRPVLEELINQVKIYGQKPELKDNNQLTIAIFEPFIQSAVVQADSSLTAFPHALYNSPVGMNWLWNDAKDDAAVIGYMRNFSIAVTEAARKDGQNVDKLALYPNYASASATLQEMYRTNLPRLKQLAAKYDPKKVMARSGGYNFQ